MVPKKCKIRCQGGFSLINIMFAVAIFLVALIGTSNFRYYSALDAKKAVARTTASRIGLMLCENWRGLGGIEAYDPVAYLGTDLTITTSATGPVKPTDFTLLGSYTVTVNNANFYITLSWKDVSAGLRALNIIVAWAQREQGQSTISDIDKSFKLTTYCS
jgi:Tfp pilus assembly protein PilV